MKWEKPGPRLREMIQMIHAIWDSWQNGTRPQFQGDFYNYSLMTPFFNPGPIGYERPKIYIAGVNEYMCRLAGELCDGFHVHPLHTIKYLDEVIRPNLRKGLEKSGRAQAALALSSSVFVITGKDADAIEKLKQRVKQQVAFYASTPAYAHVLEVHGWSEVGRRLTERSKRGDWAGLADVVTDEMVDAFAVVA